MRQKFSNFFNPNCFHDQICERFLNAFYRSCFTKFHFYYNFARFSFVFGLPRDVEEIMQITYPSFHVHLMSSKFALADLYMYQNKLTGVKFENFHDRTPP